MHLNPLHTIKLIRVIGGNMAGNHIVDLIREFGQTKLLRPDIKTGMAQLFAYRMEKIVRSTMGNRSRRLYVPYGF